MSLFISFEGVEGSGKTTQIHLLAGHLKNLGKTCVVTREPGGCPIADQIRHILLHPASHGLVPMAELLLYAAARAQHVEEIIKPALSAGHIVLCDRYIDATLAYQGFGRGLDLALIEQLNQLAAGGVRPHATILLDLPCQQGLQRARQRNSHSEGPDEDRFEQESLLFHQRVQDGYLQLARKDPERFYTVSAEGEPQEIARRIRQVVDGLLLPRRLP
jgi:dTMP kinase